MSKDLEKQIEEAAENYCENFSHDYLWQQTNIITFKKGVKSEVARQYWQQGIYTEEEVHRLLNQCNCLSKSIEDFNEQEWFEQNKKK
jgi:hypothetical protein